MNITSLISSVATSKIRLALMAAAAATLISVVVSIWLHVASLNSQVEKLTKLNNDLSATKTILESNNAVLKKNLETVQSANTANVDTIRQLNEERKRSIDAVKALASANLQNKQTLDKLNKKIEELLKDPASDGPVAPVLREVIREIQKERDKL